MSIHKWLAAGIIAIGITFGFTSCNETYTPKPKGFFRIALPERSYQLYQDNNCPFQFEIPAYAYVKSYHDSIRQPCWKYIELPQFNAEIFLSYLPVDNNPAPYIEDARTLAFKHAVKAEAIDETVVFGPEKVSGMIYDINGAVASNIQFYVTDSTRHFLRGALYFNASPQPDSLAPVIQFLRTDIEHLIKTVKWQQKP